MNAFNTETARLVDPILTTIAKGYIHAERVGNVLFPRVDVPSRGGRIVKFDKSSFRKVNSIRAPGSDTKTIQLGYEGEPFHLIQDALNTVIPREHVQEARNGPGIKMQGFAVESIMNRMTLALEVEQAALATNSENFSENQKSTLDVASQFSNPDSDPEKTIGDAKDVVRMATGSDPNVFVISKPIFRALKRHPKIVDRFKYTSADSITTKMLASYFELEKLAVGASVELAGEDDSTFTDVWGNHAVLAYAPQTQTTFQQPSFGYTYTLDGNPMAEKPHWDNGKKAWIYGVTYERQAILCGAESGFLFSNVVVSEAQA